MSLDHYTNSRVIGKGSYGEVWLVKHKKDKKQYVLKKLDLHNASKRERKAAEQEAKLLSKLKHPNIVSYKDSFEGGDGYLYIAMGYCEGGDLYNKLKESRGSLLEERQVVEWFVQIAMALQYMHERNILHRDLKTQNIFLTKSKIIKVGDLGIARVLDSASDMATTLIGTPYYMSPELFSNKPYNHKSDVWALGCCVYEMTTLKHAFNAKDMNSLVYKILRGKMPIMPKLYSPELVNLIKAMLNQNPDKRPSVSRILRDPYIKKNIAIFLEGTKKSRRPSSSRGEDSVDGNRRPSGSSDAAKQRREQERKRLQAKPLILVEENLEPLNLGPNLEPISEELENTAGSQKSSVSRASPSPSSRPPAVVPSDIKQSKERSTDSSSQHRQLPVTPTNKASRLDTSVDNNGMYSSPKRSKSPRSRPLPASSPTHQRSKSTSSVPVSNNISDNKHVSLSSVSSASQQRYSSGRSDRSSSRDREERNKEEEEVVTSQEQLNKPKLKKKKRLKERLADRKEAQQGKKDDVSSSSVLKSSSSSSGGNSPKPVIKNSSSGNLRPLPPPPVAAVSGPTRSSGNRESGYGTGGSVSSSAGAEETPRNPPMSARDRRRMQRSDVETPRTARSVDLERKKRIGDIDNPRRRSEDYDQLKRADINNKQILRPKSAGTRQQQPPPVKKPPTPVRARQPSLPTSTSSSSSSQSDSENDEVNEKIKDKKRKDKEMNNFISLLNTTLKMHQKANGGGGGEVEEEEEEEKTLVVEEQPAIPPREPIRPAAGITYTKSAPSLAGPVIPVIDTPSMMRHNDSVPLLRDQRQQAEAAGAQSMTTTGRLWERITMLRKDCIRGLGVEKLKRAYDILDNVENEDMEPLLVDLLGQEDFEIYAGKIWQLKFCEEAAFGLV